MADPLKLKEGVRDLPAVKAGLRLLAKLPAALTYHVASHTDDVLAEVLAFAVADDLSPRECELLAVAAAFHDTGFIEKMTGNEAIGARFAGEAMSRCGGYSAAETALVETMIRDTEVKLLPGGPRQVPTTKLSQYICDGDVSNLGRPDFFEKAELVRREINVPRDEVFFTNLRKFIGGHEWYTPAAKAARTAGKAANIAALDMLIKNKAW